MTHFNWVDYIIFAIFFFSIITGFSRGFIREVVSLLTLIAAFVIAIMFAQALANLFTSSSPVQSVVSETSSAIGVSTAKPASYVALGISFGILFMATVLVGSIISYLLNALFQFSILSIGNRLLGGVFGCIRGFIFTLVPIFILQLTFIGTQPWWQQSECVKSFQPAVQWLGNILSPKLSTLKAKFGQTLQDINSQLGG